MEMPIVLMTSQIEFLKLSFSNESVDIVINSENYIQKKRPRYIRRWIMNPGHLSGLLCLHFTQFHRIKNVKFQISDLTISEQKCRMIHECKLLFCMGLLDQ